MRCKIDFFCQLTFTKTMLPWKGLCKIIVFLRLNVVKWKTKSPCYVTKMLVICHLFVLLSWLSQCMGRGPHHPHGHHAEHKHHHYKPSSDSLTSDTKLLHDTKHLEEDSKVLTAETLAKMTPEELEFHYFSSHDYDGNSKLDGLEILKAVYHTIEHSFPEEHEDDSIEPEATDMEAFVAIVDRTLLTDDTDGDGYVSYSEYRAARINNTDDRTPRIVNQNYNTYLRDVKVRHIKLTFKNNTALSNGINSMLLPHYYANAMYEGRKTLEEFYVSQ